MSDWDSVYQKEGVFQIEPAPGVVQAIEVFNAHGVSRVLDLGCGTGRHAALLIERGFEVYGCDVSEEAIRLVREKLPQGRFEVCSFTLLAYEDECFDGIVCNHVIQHGRLAEIRRAVREIERVLRPGGLLFLTTISPEHPKCSTGEEIEPRTRVGTDALDGHVPHHFFTEEEMRGLFREFEIQSLIHRTGASELEPEKGTAFWELLARKG